MRQRHWIRASSRVPNPNGKKSFTASDAYLLTEDEN